jgi:tetratricopeptide (TPR) repeat protein
MKWKSFAAATLLVAAALQTPGSDADLWKSDDTLRRLGIERVELSDFREAFPLLQSAIERDPRSPAAVAALANAYHLQRRLDEAAVQYAELLRLRPATLPKREQEDAILRFAPRIFQTASDPFPLKDVVAVHHPVEPMIAYHFFWADDIDFPEDNDPCDHELVWVKYDRATGRLSDFVTYFHGRLLRSSEAIQDAHRHEERPRVNVQWGKHGSLPFGWERLSIQANNGDVESRYLDLTRPVSIEQYNRATYLKLHNEGRRLIDHPLGRSWPPRFSGSWEEFVNFTKPVDIRTLLIKRRAITTSEWNNAVLQQQFLSYNFRPKTEWPDSADDGEAVVLRRALAPASDPLTQKIADLRALPDDLPPARIFKPETPRYPNVWFYAPVTDFPTLDAYVGWLQSRFEAAGYSSDAVSLNEGADIALSIEHLQPWTSVERLSHSHALHIRFFWKRLQQSALEQAPFGSARTMHWRVAASIHYEVEHANPLHADVEVCPVCGRTGAYAAKTGSLVEHVHDPLGLELLLFGTVRGEHIPEVALVLKHQTSDWIVATPPRPDMNTEAVALVTVTKSEER